MPHGLEVYDANGSAVLRISDHLSRIVYQREVGEEASGSVQLTLPAGMRAVAVAQFLGAAEDYRTVPHKVSLSSDGLLSWAAHGGDYTTGPSLVMVVAYG